MMVKSPSTVGPIVLIVEDSASSLDIRRQLFEYSGFRTLGARSQAEAEAIIKSADDLDIIVTDINLVAGDPSDRSGVHLARLAMERRPGIPVMGYSAMFSPGDLGQDDWSVFEHAHGKGEERSADELFSVLERYRKRALAYRQSRLKLDPAAGPPRVGGLLGRFPAYEVFSPCAALFVGVGRVRNAPKLVPLPGAPADAQRMAGYFQAARPEGRWKVLADSAKRRLGKEEVIKGLRECVQAVPKGYTGMFYFSGHAEVAPGGLVLATGDYRPDLKEDSGLALKRVLELLKQSGVAETRFLMILDCCRSGDGLTLSDDVRPHVCILYACSEGEETLERVKGGILTEAILAALVGRSRDEGVPLCDIATLYNHILAGISVLGATSKITPELIGRGSESIYLPSVEYPPQKRKFVRSIPVCRLVSHPMSAEASSEFFLRLQPQLDGPLSAYLDDEGRSVVTLPRDNVQARAQRFLDDLLRRNPDEFVELTIEWPYKLAPGVFRALADALSIKWKFIQPDQYMLFWEDYDGRGGQALIDTPSPDHTTVRLNCLTSEDHKVSLYYLWPKLGQIFDRIRWAGLRVEGGALGPGAQR